jgi:dTDP-4-amino-4,6-dideoxygalactose transaminase
LAGGRTAHFQANLTDGLHYPVPVHLQNCYREWGCREGSLPVTERVAAEILSLPMFPGLTAEQQERVAAAIEAHCLVRTAVAL